MKLQEWMRAHAISDQGLADALGKQGYGYVSRIHILRIRRGLGQPSLGLALAIEKFTAGKVKPKDFEQWY